MLSDTKTRRLYDKHGFEGLRQDFEPSKARQPRSRKKRSTNSRRQADADNLFADILGGRSPFDTSHMRDFGSFDTSLERGQDLTADLAIDLVTAITGGKACVRLPHRTVEIDVPEGTRDGDILEFRGEGGEPTSETGLPGDVMVDVTVQPHPLLRRDGLDLYLDVPVTVAEAVNGATIVIPTPRGDFEVTVPSGVHTGTKLRLAGQGVCRGTKEGDFFAIVQVHTPDYVDDEIAEAAVELSRGYSEDVRGDLKL